MRYVALANYTKATHGEESTRQRTPRSSPYERSHTIQIRHGYRDRKAARMQKMGWNKMQGSLIVITRGAQWNSAAKLW